MQLSISSKYRRHNKPDLNINSHIRNILSVLNKIWCLTRRALQPHWTVWCQKMHFIARIFAPLKIVSNSLCNSSLDDGYKMTPNWFICVSDSANFLKHHNFSFYNCLITFSRSKKYNAKNLKYAEIFKAHGCLLYLNLFNDLN